MSNIKHYYHTIWLFQDQITPINPHYFEVIKQKVINEFVSLKCDIVSMAILGDHIHCAFSYGGELSTPSIYKQVKGAVSYDINSNKLIETDLYWEKGYDSYTISPSAIKNVIEYLQIQEDYHQKLNVHEELKQMRRSAGIIR
jgi:REP element-mobilizing transposase RayT